MPTINQYAMRSILRYMDDAMVAIAVRDARDMPGITESGVAWNLRMARERLLGFAIGAVDVEVEPEEAANDNIDMDRAA